MCRIPKVLVVAPSDRHLELRRQLSSLEYDVVATVTPDQAGDVTADVALIAEPAPGVAASLRDKGIPTAGPDPDADLVLEDLGQFKERFWELLRAR